MLSLTYNLCRADHIVRLREDLHLNFMLVPALPEAHANEHIFYPAYESLLKAMFPADLEFFVSREFSPIGAYVGDKKREDTGVFYCSLLRIPLCFVEIKPRSHAYSAEERYKGDRRVRGRLREIVRYLRDVCPYTCPNRVYALSALGLHVRFYYAEVSGDVGDPINIRPPPGPQYSSAYCYDDEQYDHWRLSVLDCLSVRTFRSIRDNVHKFAELLRSDNVPGTEEELEKFQETSCMHVAAMEKPKKVLHDVSDRPLAGTSRCSSPLSSIHATVGDHPELADVQGAIPGQARTVVPDVEDKVFFGTNFADRDFKRLGLAVPEGRVSGHMDLYTLLGDMEPDDDD